MRSIRLISIILVALPGCLGAAEVNPRDGVHDASDAGAPTRPACPIDPDCAIGGDCSLYVCPEYWVCEDLPNGNKRCINPGPEYPDDGGGWQCEDVGGVTRCRRPGNTYPDDGRGSEWSCELAGEFVVCTDSTPTYPDDGAGGPYTCWFEDEFRVCESIPGDGGGWSCFDSATGRQCRNDDPSYPDDREWTCWDEGGDTVCRTPGGDLPDDGGGSEWVCELSGEFVVCRDDTPDYPDGGGDDAWDCRFGDEFRVCTPPDDGGGECVPGVQRWCDDAVYCSWGKQTCLPDGTWGPCIEPTVVDGSLADRPDNDCGCRYFYFNAACCEDQEDRDGDGHPDCIIPESHTVPACPSDGGLCSYCDTTGDCGGPADLCVLRSDGYAMCGRDCSATPCPSGYTCQELTTRAGTVQQCVPASGACE